MGRQTGAWLVLWLGDASWEGRLPWALEEDTFPCGAATGDIGQSWWTWKCGEVSPARSTGLTASAGP